MSFCMSEMVQSIKLKIVCNFKISHAFIILILFLIQHKFKNSRLVVYETEYDVKRQGVDTSTKKMKNS